MTVMVEQQATRSPIDLQPLRELPDCVMNARMNEGDERNSREAQR